MIYINNISGINEDGINNVINDIYNCAENIHKNIELISDSIDLSKEFFKNDVGDSMRIKYENSKANLNIIYERILHYTDILTSVKMKYQDLNFNVTKQIQNNADKI